MVNTALSGIEAFLPFKSAIPGAHVVHGLSYKKSCGGFGGAQRGTGAGPYHDEQGGVAFLETGTLRC